jgi:hypothetical protein
VKIKLGPSVFLSNGKCVCCSNTVYSNTALRDRLLSVYTNHRTGLHGCSFLELKMLRTIPGLTGKDLATMITRVNMY